MEVTERGNAASSVLRFLFIYQQAFCSVICLQVRLLPDYLTPPSDINAPAPWFARQADATKCIPGVCFASYGKQVLQTILILTHTCSERHNKIIHPRCAQCKRTRIIACLLLSRKAHIEGTACLRA